jgi:hypothetical protein
VREGSEGREGWEGREGREWREGNDPPDPSCINTRKACCVQLKRLRVTGNGKSAILFHNVKCAICGQDWNYVRDNKLPLSTDITLCFPYLFQNFREVNI